MPARRSLLVVAVIGVALLRAAHGWADVNVKDFGAVGDGATDDTAAIQAAVEAVGGISQKYPGTAYYAEMEPLRFPNGKYRISDTITITNGRILGEGAIIEQTNPDKDIFFTDYAWRLKISGFTFLSGRNHIRLHNPNLDSGQIQIDECRFYGATGTALDIDIVSTTLSVTNCIFLQCMKVWVNRGCDQAIMRDCWITTHSEMRDAAAIEHHAGRLTIENLCGVPLVNGDNQRWIDNHGWNVTCKQVRFGGEGGGFRAVVNYRKYDQPFGPTIVLDDCLVCGSGAVYCEEVPNQIHIRDCLFGGGVPVVVSDEIDLDAYFEAKTRDLFSFTATGNTGCGEAKLPKGLTRVKLNLPPPVGMTDAEAKRALKAAVAAQAPTAEEDATDCEYEGHAQRSQPGTFTDLSPSSVTWHVRDFMDAAERRNAEHLAFAPVGTDMVIMRRTSAEGTWPHVSIEDVTVDLDTHPFLTWKQKPTGSDAPGTYAVRVFDVESGQGLLLEENHYPPWDAYRAFNLRELLGQTGKRTLRIRYYHLGMQHLGKDTNYAQPGEHIVLDFLRLEAE